jgi:hypothetical protein
MSCKYHEKEIRGKSPLFLDILKKKFVLEMTLLAVSIQRGLSVGHEKGPHWIDCGPSSTQK